MASDYTEGLGVELIGAGDKAGSWGDVTNNNLQALEEGISRYAEIGITTDAIASDLDIPDGTAAYSADSKGRSSVIKWTGTVAGGTHTVTLKVGGNPRTQARFTAVNSLSGTSNLVISCGAGTNVTIPNGYSAVIHIDGTNVVNSLANLSVDTLISSGLITGNLQGNATTVTNGVYTGNNLSALSAGATSTELRTRVTDPTGTGSLVFSTAPALTAPALGEPTALTGTNITGTASGLTAGSVTTIPALSGDVTSSGSFNTAITLADDVVSEPKLNVSNGPTDGYILSAQSGGGGLEWIPPGTAGSVTSITQGTGGIVVTNPTSASPTISLGLPVSSANTATSITGITNDNIVQLADTQTLTNKILTSPDIDTPDIDGGTINGVAINSSTIGATTATTGRFSATGANPAVEVNSLVGLHLNTTQTYFSFGAGYTGETGFRHTSGGLDIRNTRGDAFGHAYHANMVSGQSVFFESSVNLGSVGSGSLIANFSASQLHAGFTTTPKILRCVIRCINTLNAGGYAFGDEIPVESLVDADESQFINDGVTCGANAANVFVHCKDLNGMYMVPSGGGGTLVAVELAYWDIYMYAWK